MEVKQDRRRLPSSLRRALLILSLITFPSLVSATSSSSSSEKVSLELYYETLCPWCANFIVNYLYKIFDNGIIDITDLKLIPYGNAHVLPPNSTIVCQHGSDECLLNTIEACAIDAWPDLNVHFPFVYCVESLVHEDKATEWATCFEKLSLDPKPVNDCYKNGRGKELELRYADVTNSLKPHKTYVPWVVVNGQPLYEDYDKFLTEICKAYTGTRVPLACSEYSVAYSKTKGRKITLNPVCHAGATIKSVLSAVRSAVSLWIPKVTDATL